MAEFEPLKVVLTPEALGRAIVDPDQAEILRCWRDGQIKLVANRAWVVRCLRLLHRLALPERLIRWWGWWLGSHEKCFVAAQDWPESKGVELCDALARAAGADWVVHGGVLLRPAEGASENAAPSPKWITARELVEILSQRGP